MPDLKLAIVTDIHHGRNSRSKRGSAAINLLDGVLKAADRADVQAVIDLGDRITDADRDYYQKDSGLTDGAEHPEDSATTERVVTLMLASEY